MKFPENLKYTNDHEWIEAEGNIRKIGITDHAQGELGDVVYIDIADDLEEVKCGESFGTIEAVKTVADMHSPASGKVVEINHELNSKPETLNTDPYGDGWMIKIEISDPSELDSLMDAAAYKTFVGE
jgi:glycine cleavage system H protein